MRSRSSASSPARIQSILTIVIAVDGFHLLKVAGIYGSNAAGKSNLIKAVRFMQQLIAVSATRMNEGDRIEGAVPFLLSAETRTQSVSRGSDAYRGGECVQIRLHGNARAHP